MSDESWIPYEFKLPQPDEEVEWRRRFYDQTPFVASWRSFPAEFNVAGLSWRPLSVKLAELGLDGKSEKQ